ncbi:glycosyltransferase family 4 protein [Vibrio breoganii]
MNASNLTVGGGVQVGLSLIHEFFVNYSKMHDFLIVCTDTFAVKYLDCSSLKICTVTSSPSKIRSRRKVVSELNAIEKDFNPDLVFSIFGPSYWRPKSFHLCGFALGWITNPNSIAYDVLPLRNKIKRRLDSMYKLSHLRNEVDHFIVETLDVKIKLEKLGFERNSITVIGNTCSHLYDNMPEILEKISRESGVFRFITISHNYPHKNILILNDVVKEMKNIDSEFKFEFGITISDDEYSKYFYHNSKFIKNLGVLNPKNCLYAYANANALFLPTLLESFSASYPEAMKSELPIATSDLSFARELCGDAAIYFDPLDAKNIATKLIELAKNSNYQKALIEKGNERFKDFETSRSRAKKYISLFKEILSKNEADSSKH